MTADGNEHKPTYQERMDSEKEPPHYPGERFDRNELPEGEARELYDKAMAMYFSGPGRAHNPTLENKHAFDLLDRTRENMEKDALDPQTTGSEGNGHLSDQDIRMILLKRKAAGKRRINSASSIHPLR